MRVAHTLPVTCAAACCHAKIRTGLLMCAPHWDLVTRSTQQLVYRTLREWKHGASARPYLDARSQAIHEASCPEAA